MCFKEYLCFGEITFKKQVTVHLLHFCNWVWGLLKLIFTGHRSLSWSDGECYSQMLCLKSLGQRLCSGVGAVKVIKHFVVYFTEQVFKELMWPPHVPVQISFLSTNYCVCHYLTLTFLHSYWRNVSNSSLIYKLLGDRVEEIIRLLHCVRQLTILCIYK